MSDIRGKILMTFVVPCLNESPRIEQTLENIQEGCRLSKTENYEILVVDDYSTDDTSAVVRRYIERTQSATFIRLIRHEQNRGLGRSYVDSAFLARGKYYRLVCGDAAEPSLSIAQVLSQRGQADIILPVHDRLLPGRSLGRHVISKFFTFLVNRISGHQITYYNGSPLVLRYDVMRWAPNSFGFGFQADLVTRLLDEGRSHREVFVEVTHVEKDRENSALNLRNFLSVGHTLLEISIRRARKFLYPLPPNRPKITPPEETEFFP